MKDWPLSGFADEIDPELDVQLSTLTLLGIGGLDLRSAFGKNVMALTDDEAREVRRQTEDAGLVVQAIGSPIGKSPDASAARAIELAHLTGTRRIRMFTPELPENAFDRVQAFLEPMIAEAEATDVVLLHENDGTLWGAYPLRSQRMFDLYGGPHFRAAFDFANTVILGYGPGDWFPWLLPHLDTIHIKDAVRATKTVVPAGEGDGEIEATLRMLIDAGWQGPLTLEPHLAHAGTAGGFSGADLFARATQALTEILCRLGGGRDGGDDEGDDS